MKARVAIMTSAPGWHGYRLARSFAALGVETRFVSLSDCRVDLDANRYGIVIPGFKGALPDGVFVREIDAGTFEQVTFRLSILHALAEWEVPVYNSARAIERTVDKSMTSMLLRRAGIPTPSTWVSEQSAAGRAVLMRQTARGHRLVLKPLFGSQGHGLQRLGAGDALPETAEYAGVYYLQRFVESRPRSTESCDYRVFVIGGRSVAAMVRRGADWVHNVAQGAQCAAIPLAADLCELSEHAVRTIGLDYAGVDLMRTADGAAVVIEVNGIPAWQGLQSVARVDIAQLLAQDFVARRLSAPHRAVL
jgi:tetrahydromethanopterin:alpha-L-glutamate ligase